MSSGGGDQEVTQKSEPFRQQIPYIERAFGLAGNRLDSLTPPGNYGGYQAGYGGQQQIPGGSYGGVGSVYTGNVPQGPAWQGVRDYLGSGGVGQAPDRIPQGPAYQGLRDYIDARQNAPQNPSGGPGSAPVPGAGQVPPGSSGAPGGLTTDNFSQVFQNRAEQFGLPTLNFFPGQTVAGFDANTLLGQSLARGGAENIATANEGGTGAFNRLLNADPFGNSQLNNLQNSQAFNNPALQSLLRNPDPTRDPTIERFAQAAVRPLEGQRDQLLRADDDRAISQGAFGGSRQQLNRGQIRNDFAQRVGDVRAGIYNNAFNQQFAAQQNALGIAANADQVNRNTQLGALGLGNQADATNRQTQLGALSFLPTLNQQQTGVADIYSRIGAQNENLNQSFIDSERERFEFEQAAPDLAINQYSNLINQFSGPTASTQVASSKGPGALGTAIGAGLAGAGAYGLFSGPQGG